MRVVNSAVGVNVFFFKSFFLSEFFPGCDLVQQGGLP